MDEKEIEEMDRYMYIKGNYRTLVLLLSVSVSFVFFDTLWSMMMKWALDTDLSQTNANSVWYKIHNFVDWLVY